MGNDNVLRQSAWRDEYRTYLRDGTVIRTARIPKTAPASTGAGVLRKAADIIRERGLAKGQMRDANGCRCLYAALLEAAGLGYDLDVPISTGHIDARQVDTWGAYRRFDVLTEALELLGQPEAKGGITWIAPLARWSDKSSAGHVTRLLYAASYGIKPTWTSTEVDPTSLPR